MVCEGARPSGWVCVGVTYEKFFEELDNQLPCDGPNGVAAIELLDSWKPPSLDTTTRAKLALAALRACGPMRPPAVPAAPEPDEDLGVDEDE